MAEHATLVEAATRSRVEHIPEIGLGTWKAPRGVVGQAVYDALRAGYRHIDCAPVYCNEKEVGEGLRRAFDEGVVKREDIWVTSKLWPAYAGSLERARELFERTLSDLGLEYLDLYILHYPCPFKEGPRTIWEDDGVALDEFGSAVLMPGATSTSIYGVLEQLYLTTGRIRHIGVSNYPAFDVAQVLAACKVRPYVNQIEQNLFCGGTRHVEYCVRYGIRVTGYSPFGGSEHGKGGAPSVFDHPVVASVARKHGATAGAVALSWVLRRHPGMMSVLAKSVRPERLAENLRSGDVSLDADDMRALDDIERTCHHRSCCPWAFWRLPLWG